MNLYDLHDDPETLKGNHEKNDIVVDLVIEKINKSNNKSKLPIFTEREIQTIKKSAYASFLYARRIIDGQWKEGEDAIAKNGRVAHAYAQYVLQRSWPKGEDAIAKDPWASMSYAKDLLGGRRFKKGEDEIVKQPRYSIDYAIDHMREAWPEAETYFSKFIKNESSALDVARYAIKFSKKMSPEIENQMERYIFSSSEFKKYKQKCH